LQRHGDVVAVSRSVDRRSHGTRCLPTCLWRS
jgi:hypothetical protein